MIEPINNAIVDIPTQFPTLNYFFCFFYYFKIDRALSGKQFKYLHNFLILRSNSSHLFNNYFIIKHYYFFIYSKFN